MIFCHKNEKEITLGADSAQENWGSRAKVSGYCLVATTIISQGESLQYFFYLKSVFGQ